MFFDRNVYFHFVNFDPTDIKTSIGELVVGRIIRKSGNIQRLVLNNLPMKWYYPVEETKVGLFPKYLQHTVSVHNEITADTCFYVIYPFNYFAALLRKRSIPPRKLLNTVSLGTWRDSINAIVLTAELTNLQGLIQWNWF